MSQDAHEVRGQTKMAARPSVRGLSCRFVRPAGLQSVLPARVRPLRGRATCTARGVSPRQTPSRAMVMDDQRSLLQQQSAALLDALFASAPVGLAILDRELRYVRINEALAELNGLSCEQHIGRTIQEVLPDVAQVAVPAFLRVLETGEPLLEWQLTGETAAAPGETRQWIENVYPLLGERGAVVGLGAIVVDVTARKQAEEAQRAVAERRAVIVHMAEAQEEERKRIAADIHDDVLQAVSALGARLDRLQREHPAAATEVGDLREDLQRAIRRLRHLVFDLRPPALDLTGLADAIRLYLEEQRHEWGLEYKLDASLHKDLPEAERVLLYRIAQEAIANVRRHASADLVEVTVSETDGGVCLTIVDNGKGLPPAALDDRDPRHFGLAIMRERAEQAGGWWGVESESGLGTTVRCWLPGQVDVARAAHG
jgi:PAS domain S-box-containing protein